MKKLDPEALKLASSFLRDYSAAIARLETERAKINVAAQTHRGELLDRLVYLVKPLGFTREQLAANQVDIDPETGDVTLAVDELAKVREDAIAAEKKRAAAKLLDDAGEALAQPKDNALLAFVDKVPQPSP